MGCVAWLKRVVKTPFCRMFVLLYVVTFLVVLPIVCHTLRFSLYFIHKDNEVARSQMRKVNDKRIEQANRYISMLQDSKLQRMLQQFKGFSPGLDLAITIITVSRNRHKFDSYEPRYLKQVVWKFLALMHKHSSDEMKLKIKLSVCNVDFDPGSYYEAQEMAALVPVFNRFNQTTLPIVQTLEKEKQDYVFCLNQSLQYRPRYALLVEDDALPNEDFLDIVEDLVYKHLDYRFHGDSLIENHQNFAYVKLYHPERLLGFYSIEPERIPELLSFGAIFGTCVTVIHWLFSNKKSMSAIYGLWFSYWVYFILVAIAIGRQHLVELRRLSSHLYSYVPAPSCCTPAMLFQNRTAQDIVMYLDKVQCKTGFAKDMALQKFREDNHLPAYLVQPNLVNHIGLYSSLRHGVLDPYVV